jgi:ubiquitin carboxyl-terminal hydrolase 34
LKDIPDHLIFHLKRFDFDLQILQRSKVNDEFHFPSRIDMAPFKFDTLNGDGLTATPDVFELVGILIHSGNAETGHYYSYIKQRPVASGAQAPWVEFNDIDVLSWEPSSLADNCFGGWTEAAFPGGMRFQKSWNAYMLFYQRISDIEVLKKHFNPVSDLPIQIPLPLQLGNHVALGNELAVRGYLLQDEDHAKFILHLLKKMRISANGHCTTEHRIEQRAINCALDHIEQIVVKTEFQPQFDELIFELEQIAKTCARCAWLVVDWNARNPEAIRNVLMRNKKEKVRLKFSGLFITALQVLRNPRVPVLVDSGTQDLNNRATLFEMQFSDFVKALRGVWAYLYLNIPAWDDYFKVLIKLASFGEDEVGIILDEGFLKRCLELIMIEELKLRKGRPYTQLYQRLLERKRKLPYVQLLELTRVLLDNVDLTYGPSYDAQERDRTGDGKWALKMGEDDLMRLKGQSLQLILVERLVQHHWPHDAVRRILSNLLFAESSWGDGDAMASALVQGMRLEPACDAKNALEAAVVFCTYCSNINYMRSLIRESTAFIESIGNSGGREHINYLFKLKDVRNDYCAEADQEFLRHNIRLKVADWAPTLLTYALDSNVRSLAEALVKDLLLEESEFTEDGHDRHIEPLAKSLAKACGDKIMTQWINPRNAPYTPHIEEVESVISECCRRFFDAENDGDAAALARFQRE